MCTINKSVYTKKSGNLLKAPCICAFSDIEHSLLINIANLYRTTKQSLISVRIIRII